MPGNPAPEPISKILSVSKRNGLSCKESSKCRDWILSKVFLETKFKVVDHLIKLFYKFLISFEYRILIITSKILCCKNNRKFIKK
jgi:hypothetical protein